MDYHREIVNFNAYRMDLCTLPIVKPVWMSMMAMLAWVNFSRIDNTLWSREKCLASQSLHIAQLEFMWTLNLEEHWNMILGIVHTATTMFPFFNNWQNCDISRNRWLGYWCIVYICCATGSYMQWNVLINKKLMQMQWAKYRKTWECRTLWRSQNKSLVKGFIKIHGGFMN